ncbi:MAG: DUF4846 domain-containing protein [Verrucomicrobia bacterium]|nr:DUF4846 domain-containing protein [Cytophagales bacterium]
MKKISVLLLCLSGIIQACHSQDISPEGKTLAERFLLPKGYFRKSLDRQSFAFYLRNFPLKSHGSKVYYFDKKEKYNPVYSAVLAIDCGTRDLQQCADAVMRLRSEYLYKQQKIKDIHFKNFAGTDMDYVRYKQGYRMTTTAYKKTNAPDTSRQGFRKYLDMVFAFANTYTLEREMLPQSIQDLQAGDVFIVSKANAYGHAVIIMDVAFHEKTKEKIFLLAQSYMPAQDIHILKNTNEAEHPNWYSAQHLQENLVTPEWTFPVSALKKFK